MDTRLICRLASGDVARWQGLPAQHLKRADLPACLGPVLSKDLRRFAFGTYKLERHGRGLAHVDIYTWWGDERVAIIDAWLPTAGLPAMLGHLPPPERAYVFGAVDREQWEVAAPSDSVVEEAVWGSRGLSVVIARGASAVEVVRVRGFEPMASNQWIDGFVKFTAVPAE